MAGDAKKTHWMLWADSLGAPLSLALLAAIVGLWTTHVASSDSAQELDARYVELAVEVLAQNLPAEDSEVRDDAEALREWAVDVLDETSPTALPSSLAEALTERTVLPSADSLVGTVASGASGGRILDVVETVTSGGSLIVQPSVSGGEADCVTIDSPETGRLTVCGSQPSLGDIGLAPFQVVGQCGQNVTVYFEEGFVGPTQRLDFC